MSKPQFFFAGQREIDFTDGYLESWRDLSLGMVSLGRTCFAMRIDFMGCYLESWRGFVARNGVLGPSMIAAGVDLTNGQETELRHQRRLCDSQSPVF